MNGNQPHAPASASVISSARLTTRDRNAVSLLAGVVLIVTAVGGSLLAASRSNDGHAQRIEKICVANGGHWERTAEGGACLDPNEPLHD